MARGLVAEGEHGLGGELGEADVARLAAVGRIAPSAHALGDDGEEHVGDLLLVADRGLLKVEIDDLPAGRRANRAASWAALACRWRRPRIF